MMRGSRDQMRAWGLTESLGSGIAVPAGPSILILLSTTEAAWREPALWVMGSSRGPVPLPVAVVADLEVFGESLE